MWQDVKENAEEGVKYPYPEATEFFDWLAETDVDAVLVDRLGPSAGQRVVQTVARHTPYLVYASLYPSTSRSSDASARSKRSFTRRKNLAIGSSGISPR